METVVLKMLNLLNQRYSQAKNRSPRRMPNWQMMKAEIVKGEGFHQDEVFRSMMNKLSLAHAEQVRARKEAQRNRFAQSFRPRA